MWEGLELQTRLGVKSWFPMLARSPGLTQALLDPKYGGLGALGTALKICPVKVPLGQNCMQVGIGDESQEELEMEPERIWGRNLGAGFGGLGMEFGGLGMGLGRIGDGSWRVEGLKIPELRDDGSLGY